MNNKYFFSLLLLLACFLSHAQNEKLRLAVFDPTSSGTGVDEGTRMAVREIISSTFVNTGKYIIVERSLIEKVMLEQKFSNSGAVDDSQASEIGKLIGANKIVLSVITLAGGRNMLSLKLVDVQTANVERQKTQVITTNELLDVIEPLTLQLMGEEVSMERQTQIAAVSEPRQSERIAVERTITEPEPATPDPTPAPTPAPTSTPAPQQQPQQKEMAGLQSNRHGDVIMNGRKQSKSDVRQIMANTEALRMYNSGLKKHKAGTFIKLGGGLLFAGGAVCILAGAIEEFDTNESLINTGAVLATAGVATFITGGVIKKSGKRKIQSAVNEYNRSNTGSIEFGVGFTNNGLGLAINF